MLLRPWSGSERRGPRRAHARVPRDPESPPLPEGGAHASGRGAEREERGWVAVGSRAPPVHRPCPPRAVPPALPRLCRSRVRGLAVRVACVCRSCGVPCGVASLPLTPRQRSHDRGAAVTRPSSGPGIRFWRRGPVTSLSGAAFGETAVGRLRRVAGRVGARRRRRSFGGGGRVCLGGGSVRAWEEEALGAFRGTREGKRLSGRRPSSALSTVGPSAEVRLGTLPAPSSSGKGVRVSRVGNRHPHRVGCPAVRYPPARACRSPPVWRRGLRSMTLPVPEVRPSRASRCAGASPLTSLEGKTVRVVVASLFLSRLSRRVSEHARGPALPRDPGPLRLRVSPGGGRRPLLPPSPSARSSSARPAGSRSLPTPPGGSGITPSSPALRLAAARVYGGARRGPTPALEPPPASVGSDPRRGQ